MLLLSCSNLPIGPGTVPVSCAYLTIFGVWNSFKFIETYTIHEHHISLKRHLVAGNEFGPPVNGRTFPFTQ